VLASVVQAKGADAAQLIGALRRLDEGFIVRAEGIFDPLLDFEKDRSPLGILRLQKGEAKNVMGTKFQLDKDASCRCRVDEIGPESAPPT